MKEPEALVHVEGLRVRRGGQLILHGIDLVIDKGPPFALVGESGSGKTTLLFAAVGLLPIESGRVEIAGQSLDKLSPRERSRLLGLVFQDYQLFPHLSVMQNLTLAPRLQQKPGHETLARDLLADLGISALAERYPHELSGGQKQRVAIARSLVMEPRVLFFDEPSAALDENTTRELAKLLLRLNETTQVIIVSHDRPFIEQCCARGARMRQGRLEDEGEVKTIFG